MSQNPPPVDYSITQHIPVSNHVYKYLKVRCHGSDHIRASRNNFVGCLVLSLTGRNGDVKPQPHEFTKTFSVTISENLHSRVGMHLSAENAQLFNDQVDKLFREDLCFYLLINQTVGEKKFLASMRSFLKVYDITEDDIKIETLYRDFKRRKNKLKDKLNLASASGTN